MIKILKFPEVNNPTNATLKIADTKLYVSVVTLSTENDKKPLEQLKTGFKRTIKWNKYRSEVTNQTKNNSLKYYVPSVQIKDFNLMIAGKSSFDAPIKNDEEIYKQIIEMGINNDYATGNSLDYQHFSKHYKLITVDLSKQTEL